MRLNAITEPCRWSPLQPSESGWWSPIRTSRTLGGEAHLANIDWRAHTATLGAGILRVPGRGGGYATDAAQAILRYGLQELGLFRLEANTAGFSAPARRVMGQFGFPEEGANRKALYRGGQRWDSVIYGLLRGEFKRPGDG